MTALTAAASGLATKDRRRTRPYVVKNSQTMHPDSLCGLDADGVLVPWADDALTNRFAGIFVGFDRPLVDGSVVTAGNTSGAPAYRGKVHHGPVLEGVAVSGVSDRTPILEPVYCTTDNFADLTLTPTAFVGPIGFLCDYRSNSDQDVQLFNEIEYAANLSYGHWTRHIDLALITGAGDVVTTFTPGFRGRIVKWWAEVVTPVTTGSKAATLNLEVGTTNLTGGTIALTSAAATPLGAVIAQGSAFSAGMAFGAADTISVEAASVTAFAEGSINLVIQYQADE